MPLGFAAPAIRAHCRTAFLLALTAASARAQCPDGTPPPCRGTSTTAPVRRANPPLNARAWIVVPFGNLTKSAEIDWLRDASVNLLSLDLSRWTDVAVVPDKRVGDLVRELPPARSAEALTLSDGLAIARRAGAGMLVMGDVFRLGKGARLVANVFDVRTGAKVRTVAQQVTEQDSLLTAFGPLARGVLAVPPPADAKTGEVGTRTLGAYQAYLLGVKALNRFDLPEARKELTRALALDSTFALAHLAFSMMLEWGDESGGAQARAHALSAQRFGSALPRRERMLTDAGVAMTTPDYDRVCTIARSLAAQDSTDIQAVFLLGECSFHDDAIVVSPTDSTVGTYRGSWNTAIRSFRRVIELDPTYLGAFEHVIQLAQRVLRSARDCAPRGGASASCVNWTARVLRSGDTLEIVPVRTSNTAATNAQLRRFRSEKPTLANHALAVEVAQQWVDADPNSEGARAGLARASMMRGDLATAEAQFKRVKSRAAVDNIGTLRLMLEVAIKRGRGNEARALFDSLVKTTPDDPSIVGARGATELVFGRLARFERGGATAAALIGPEAVAYQRHVGPALLGVPRTGLARDEAAFYAAMRDSACDANCRFTQVSPTLLYSLHVPSGAWPELVAGRYADGRFDAVRALAARDTGALRRAAVRLDSLAHANVALEVPEFFTVIVADAYLALGDSTAALRVTRFFVDSAMAFMSISSNATGGFVPTYGTPLWPRMMLRRADLAAAAGQRTEAKLWYVRVLDLLADADAELQPTLARIRAALAALGPA